MTITITDGSDTVTLSNDIFWTDRHSWSPVEQSVATSITGAAIVDIGTRLNGRPITLQSDERHAWIPYADVVILKGWAAVAGKQLSLNIHGTTFSVIFRHQDAPALDLAPVVDYATIDTSDWFYGVLKFTEV